MKRHLPRPSLTLERGLTLLSSLRPPRGPPSASSLASSAPPSPNPSSPSFPASSFSLPTPSDFSSFSSSMQPHSPARSRPTTPRPSFSPTATLWPPSSSQRSPLLPLRSPPAGAGAHKWSRRRWSRFRWATTSLLAAIGLLLVWACFPSPLAHLTLLPSSHQHTAADFPATPWPPLPQPASEQYLTYLPHSGLHNQLIELQNALLLAALLGRTLLVPQIRVGQAVAYKPSAALGEDLRVSAGCWTREDPDPACEDKESYAYLPLPSIIRLPPPSAVRTLPLPAPALLPAHLAALNLTPASVFHLPDTSVYQYKFFEHSSLQRPMGRYTTRVNLDDLARETRHHKLISLGSLFGTSRVKLSTKPAKVLRRSIKRTTTFSHPTILSAAQRVVRKLGGRDAYVAAHVRLGDGSFEQEGETRVRELWWALVRSLGLSEQLAAEVEQWAYSHPHSRGNISHPATAPLEPAPDRQALKAPHPPLSPFPNPPPRPPLKCSRDGMHTRPELLALNVPLFLATPSPDSPLLDPLRRTFPCSFSLSHPQLSALLEPVRQLATGEGVQAGQWMEGVVDALVASEGRWVRGTRGSTFSGWVGDVGWRVVRGWEVVDRG
ncbi:hypothetical protein CALVIDRAFT_540190 [Calocera viscosa TUFC12733]|uniref:Uncharacterized protein n=1 Tax=Calocera viscosa (strain TUFC12733) TaxID=1330018 RepID=A0A167J3B1_CALVF|nr:hypothetical protein CALVIDRAFT_540190 [Calocera viscosa TUFC12733]